MEVFGLSPATFYDSFEEYRLTLAAHFYPHLADDRQEPVLVFIGDVPAVVESSIRTTLEEIQTFYAERFGVEAGDYTVYVGADEHSAADAHQLAFGKAPTEPFCRRAETGAAATLVFDLTCHADAPHSLGRYHLNYVRERLAPRWSLPATDDGLQSGPLWLFLAIETYANHAYRVTSGLQSLDSIQSEQIAGARQLTEPLSSLTTWDEVTPAGYWEVRALGALAGEWLAAARANLHCSTTSASCRHRPAGARRSRLPSACVWRTSMRSSSRTAPRSRPHGRTAFGVWWSTPPAIPR